jgi:ribosomal protein L11 methyltransferase
MMTTDRLVVIVVHDSPQPAAQALAGFGVTEVELQSLGAGRILVSGRLTDDARARTVAAELRRRGWVATERPADDNPAIHAWRNRTRPVSVGGGRLWIALPWVDLPHEGRTVVEIDPGAGAFGVGTHPTTRLLLEALATRLSGGESVLDVGCGSGVLALAALKLDAAAVVGIDLEAAAVEATLANAQRNGLADRVQASPTPLQELPGQFDVVLANIGLEVLLELAVDLERHLAPGGWLGLSGISPAQVSRLSAAFPSLTVVETPQLDDWAAVVISAPSSTVRPGPGSAFDR